VLVWKNSSGQRISPPVGPYPARTQVIRQLRTVVLGALIVTLGVPARSADDFLDLARPGEPDTRVGRPGSISIAGPIDGMPIRQEPWPLKVTLLSVDRTVYMIGERVTFEVSLENTWPDRLMIPWGAPVDLDRIDPGPEAPAGYLSALIGLVAEGDSIAHDGICGSRLVPQSLRWLKPGERVRVRAHSNIQTSEKRLLDSLPIEVDLKASFSFVEGSSEGLPRGDRLWQPAVSANSIRIRIERH